MIDITKPVRLADGRKARIVCTDKAGAFPLVAVHESLDRTEERCSAFSLDGRPRARGMSDLINVPPVPTFRYVNLYDEGLRTTYACITDLPEVAASSVLAQLKLTLHDGVVTAVELRPRNVL